MRMKRKETFAVSGPHIKVRFFGGWDYADTTTADQRGSFGKTYRTGSRTATGSRPPTRKASRWAEICRLARGTRRRHSWCGRSRIPTSGNLDRIQIVKGWTKSGQSFEKVFDVAWAGDRKPDKWTGVVPPIGSTVDVEKATYTNTHRRGRAEDRVDRSRIRSERSRLLLRPRARDPDAALDDDPGGAARHRAARRRARHAPGARVEFADLVHADRRSA